jgi:type IV pilus assembly protein PilB
MLRRSKDIAVRSPEPTPTNGHGPAVEAPANGNGAAPHLGDTGDETYPDFVHTSAEFDEDALLKAVAESFGSPAPAEPAVAPPAPVSSSNGHGASPAVATPYGHAPAASSNGHAPSVVPAPAEPAPASDRGSRLRLSLRGRRNDESERAAALPAPKPSYPSGQPATPGGRLLGALLVEQNLITPEQLEQALAEQEASGLRLGELLVRQGAFDERQLTRVLAEQFEIGLGDLSHQAPDPQLATRLPENIARQYMAVPLRDVDGVIEVVVGNPVPGMHAEIERAVGAPVQLFAVPPSAARQALDRTYRAIADVDRMVKAFEATDTPRLGGVALRDDTIGADSPIAKVVMMLVTEALRDRASDLHLEPSDKQLRVRFRIDGALHDVLTLPMSMSAPLVSRIKILANMNIVERRRAQDGQFAAEIDGHGIDVRVSTMATVFGEKCVMRILDKSRSLYKLSQLGMPRDTQTNYDKMVRSPFGMVLCAGPTGSGKTTTLYATLNEIDERSRNIVTIEDPVEYVFPTINQIQTNEQAGITFADGLRAILRQDPDVILVGEIRDTETARIATQAALTGHFVLSSLHATDSVAALHRFLDMGIEAFLVASSVLGVVSQRLVRRVCQSCAVPYEPTAEELAFYHEAGGEGSYFVRGAGCQLCAETGYMDRIGVYESLRMTPEIRRLLVGWATQDELRRVAIQQGMRTLRTEGLALVDQGVTTISEVIRSIYAL